MDAQRFCINLVSEPFYSKVFNPRWPHTPDEFTLEMRVNVERLRVEIVLSQPEPPPQCHPSPRWLPVVDTGSKEPGTPRWLPAIGTGSDEPGVSRAETQSTEREEFVSLQANVDDFLRFNCTSGAGVYSASTRRRGRRQKRPTNYFTTSRCSRGVRETNEEAAAAKGSSMDYRTKQAV